MREFFTVYHLPPRVLRSHNASSRSTFHGALGCGYRGDMWRPRHLRLIHKDLNPMTCVAARAWCPTV